MRHSLKETGQSLPGLMMGVALIGLSGVLASRMVVSRKVQSVHLSVEGKVEDLRNYVRNSLSCTNTISGQMPACSSGGFVLPKDEQGNVLQGAGGSTLAHWEIRARCRQVDGHFRLQVEYKSRGEGAAIYASSAVWQPAWHDLFRGIPRSCGVFKVLSTWVGDSPVEVGHGNEDLIVPPRGVLFQWQDRNAFINPLTPADFDGVDLLKFGDYSGHPGGYRNPTMAEVALIRAKHLNGLDMYFAFDNAISRNPIDAQANDASFGSRRVLNAITPLIQLAEYWSGASAWSVGPSQRGLTYGSYMESGAQFPMLTGQLYYFEDVSGYLTRQLVNFNTPGEFSSVDAPARCVLTPQPAGSRCAVAWLPRQNGAGYIYANGNAAYHDYIYGTNAITAKFPRRL